MSKTDFLFAQPGFIRGMGKSLDLWSTRNIYNSSSSDTEADYKALKSDWIIVGDDIRRAATRYGRKTRATERARRARAAQP